MQTNFTTAITRRTKLLTHAAVTVPSNQMKSLQERGKASTVVPDLVFFNFVQRNSVKVPLQEE